jgi:hypothetical protein
MSCACSTLIAAITSELYKYLAVPLIRALLTAIRSTYETTHP